MIGQDQKKDLQIFLLLPKHITVVLVWTSWPDWLGSDKRNEETRIQKLS